MDESTIDYVMTHPVSICDTDVPSDLFTSDFKVVVVAIFGVFVVIAFVTVVANTIIIVAIVRAYLYGISSPAQGSRKSVGVPGGAKHRVRLGTHSSNIPIVLMVSMAVTDALLGAVVMPLYTLEILFNGQWPLDTVSCQLRQYLDIILSVSSIYHVTCMAGDRYLAICRPFQHQKLTARAGVLAVALCWAAPMAVTFFFHVPTETAKVVVHLPGTGCLERDGVETKNYTIKNIASFRVSSTSAESRMCVLKFSPATQPITLSMNFYIPFVAIIILYAFILVELHRVAHRRAFLQGGKKKGSLEMENTQRGIVDTEAVASNGISAETVAGPGNDATCITNVATDENEANENRPVQKQQVRRTKSVKTTSRNLKAARTISVVVLCFLICWLPFSVYILVSTVTGEPGSPQLMWFILWLGYVNSCLNPIFYCSHVTIRAALKDLLSKNLPSS